MRPVSLIVCAFSIAVVAPRPAAAQVAWEGPPMVGTAAPGGLSLLVIDPSPGSGLGAMLQWRGRQGALEMGYRAGVSRDDSEDTSVFGGIDVSGILARGVEEAEIDVRWWTGVGAGVGNDLLFSIPIGLVAGWQGSGDDVVFAPYAGGHATLDLRTGEGSAVDLNASFDVGLDLTLVSGWMIRLGASLGGRDALALGVRFPTGGRGQN